MATVIQQNQSKKDQNRSAIGEGLSNLINSGTKAYTNSHDDSALQKSIGSLPENASARQILDAITNTKTYTQESKQNVLKNYLGVVEFEELQKKSKSQQAILQAKNDIALAKANGEVAKASEEEAKEKGSSMALIDHSSLSEDEKNTLKNAIKSGNVSYEAVKQLLKSNKEDVDKLENKIEKNTEQNDSKEITQKAFDEIVGLIPKVGFSGIVTSKLGGDTAKSYAQFTSLTGALEALLVEKVNRGALSNARFKYITETLLPKPSDTQSEIEGKLTGLATILDLNTSSLLGEEKSSLKKNSQDAKKRIPLTAFEG